MHDAFPQPSTADSAISHRILDANLNRAMEGLRTLEDVSRFQDLHVLQSTYKSIRHELQKCSSMWEQAELLRSRNSSEDVGRTSKTSSESAREQGIFDVCCAAAQRTQQALRCLEEVTKYQYPNSAAKIESLRYLVYDANAQLILSQQKEQSFLINAKLYLLVDCKLPLEQFRERIKEVSVAGVDLIQIRDKDQDAQALIQYTQAAAESVDFAQTRIVVNDRADVLGCTNAWGLHVGQTDLSVPQSRSLIRSNCVIGLSTHNLEQVIEAVAMDVDYIGCGPTFPSTTKQFDSFSGLDFLTSVASFLEQRNSKLPAFAIGGIQLSNLKELLATGIRRIAVSQAIWGAEKPVHAAERMRAMLDNAN